jgi:phospholipase A1
MHRLCHLLICALLASSAAASAAAAADDQRAAADAAACAGVSDPAARLACYDRFFRAPAENTATAPDSAQSQGAAPGSMPPQASVPSAARAPTSAAEDRSPLSRTWELAPDEKRGTFAVRTYRPNYLLPLHYTSSLAVPSSPTHPAPAEPLDLRRVEAKFQVSLRAKALEDVGLPGADLWLAYSQISIWQLYNHGESSPFRSSDYQPEAIYVVPVGGSGGLRLPAGWRWRMVQLGVAHQSNGQGDPLSRSWNRVWLGAAFDRGPFSLQLRANQRVRFRSSDDDNPDLVHYIGRGELLASYVGERTIAALTWRTGSGFLRRGSLQLDWSYPVRRLHPEGLRWYVQVFHGYGETLIDYNHRQTSVGAGLALFQF